MPTCFPISEGCVTVHTPPLFVGGKQRFRLKKRLEIGKFVVLAFQSIIITSQWTSVAIRRAFLFY